MESIYRWKGEVQNDPEVLALLKTTESGYPALEAALVELHPYEVPEVIALKVEAGSQPYLGWVGEQIM